MKDGSIYEGSFIDGEICGKGRRFYAISKSEYTGHFMFGERHGYGLMVYGDGSTYKGDWCHNLQQGNSSNLCSKKLGNGEYIDANKCKYVGEFFQNKKSGPGCLYSHTYVALCLLEYCTKDFRIQGTGEMIYMMVPGS